jgi:hypothetical protein
LLHITKPSQSYLTPTPLQREETIKKKKYFLYLSWLFEQTFCSLRGKNHSDEKETKTDTSKFDGAKQKQTAFGLLHKTEK